MVLVVMEVLVGEYLVPPDKVGKDPVLLELIIQHQ